MHHRARAAAACVAACLLSLVGCSSEPDVTADGLAAVELPGQTVERTVTDNAQALDFLSPDVVKIGVVDAAHVIGKPVTFTVYQYNDSTAAETAMAAWRTDVDDGMMGDFPFAQPVTTGDPDDALSGATDDHLIFDAQPVTHVVARKGAFIVRTIGDRATAASAAASILGNS